MTKHIRILTAGGDSPGLNAAITAIGKLALDTGKWKLSGNEKLSRSITIGLKVPAVSEPVLGLN